MKKKYFPEDKMKMPLVEDFISPEGILYKKDESFVSVATRFTTKEFGEVSFPLPNLSKTFLSLAEDFILKQEKLKKKLKQKINRKKNINLIASRDYLRVIEYSIQISVLLGISFEAFVNMMLPQNIVLEDGHSKKKSEFSKR